MNEIEHISVDYIYDVNSSTFDTRVIRKSHQTPVLVDFWAAWCAPCQTLMPLLRKIAEEYQGAFMLAKVNTDLEKEIAAQYQIRSLPTVALFKNGQIVNQFVGAQPESVIKQILSSHVRSESDIELERAVTLLNVGDNHKAVITLRAAIDKYPHDDRLKLKLAEVLLEDKALDQANLILSKISRETKDSDVYNKLQIRIEFQQKDDPSLTLDELVKEVQSNPGDMVVRDKLAIRYVLSGAWEKAMEEYLEIVKRDRAYMNDAGRKSLLKIFDLLGGRGEMVNRYRALLAQILN